MKTIFGMNDLNGLRPSILIGRSVFLETLRRKDLYVLVILSLLYIAGILFVNLVGIENPDTANFLLNLGMSLAWFFAHILTLLNASRQIPDDMENHTIYPLIAKPLKRSQYILGKWGAVSLSGIVSLLVFLFFGWLLVPKQMNYSAILLVQMIFLYMVSLALFSAIALFFSLFIPKSVNLVLLAILVFLGDNVLDFIKTNTQSAPFGRIIGWLLSYIPDFSLFNLTTRYTDGIGPLSISEFAGLLFYAVVMTAFFLFIAVKMFKKRAL